MKITRVDKHLALLSRVGVLTNRSRVNDCSQDYVLFWLLASFECGVGDGVGHSGMYENMGGYMLPM